MSFFPSAVDRLFARFCRTGDAAALGKVFDRTAPELLRVACWLAGNRADAEDLVQRTFLAAIESREAFAGGRAMPWLLGILGNHVRRLRKERARTLPAMAEPVADPRSLAAERELQERLRALREELGEPYAEVLRLHLEEGLDAKEIAERLQRPAGTVRTQVVRGMELVRRRLPDGFVAGSALALIAGTAASATAIASIRAVVLPAANAAAPAVASAFVVLGGFVVSKKVALSVSLVLALSVLGPWLAWPDQPAEAAPSPGVAAVEVANAGARVAPEEAAATAGSGASEARQRVAATGATESVPEPGFAIVRVIARWGGGKPAADVGVFASQGRAITRREAVTDAEGTAELLHLAPGTWTIGATLGTTDGISSGGAKRCTLLAGESQVVELDVGTIATAKGRVVDAAGRPVADARIWVSVDGDGNQGQEVARSDADGAFATPILGAHYFGARKPGYAPSHVLLVNPLNCEDDLVLQLLHEGGSVRGVVRDERGQPIAWAKVRVGQEVVQLLNSNTQPRREQSPCGVDVTTAQDGAFFVDSAPVGLVTVHVGAPGFAPKLVPVDVPAGGTGRCEIVLERGARVHGTIRDQNGAPVAGATVGLRSHGEFAGTETESAADGSYVLADLPAGHLPLEARRGGARANKQALLGVGEDLVWDPVLGTSFVVRGRVVDERGKGLRDCEIAVWREQDLRARCTSAEDGSFALDEVGADELVLEVSMNFDSLLHVPAVQPGTEDLVVVVDDQHLPTGTIAGRLLDEKGKPVDATLVPWHPESDRARHHKTDPATGVFRIGPVRPGRYKLTCESTSFGRVELGEHELGPNQVLDLGDRVMKAPGGVDVEVVLAGRPAAGGVVVFFRDNGQWIDSTPIEHGMAKNRVLPAERVSVYADYQGSVQFAEVDVTAGAVTPLRLELQRPFRATIRLVDPRGTSREELAPVITAFREDGSRASRFGPVGLPGDPTFFVELPPAVYLLKVSTKDGRSLEERVDLRAGHLERTLRLAQ